MLVLATVPVHETTLANQHYYSILLGRREGICKKSTLCTLVKMLKIMDGLLIIMFRLARFHLGFGNILVVNNR